MAVELGASRLLAPYFSSSQIVWTIIIGTIMIAMALGNIYGGKAADKNPNPDKLYGRILIASIWIALIPVLGKYIILGISGLLILTVSTNFLIIAAFAACMIIFVFPLFLLGTVTPCLVKYSVDSLNEHHRKHYRNFRADLYFDTDRRHVDNLSYFCGNSYNAFGGLIYIVENKHDEDKKTSRCDPHIRFKLRLRA